MPETGLLEITRQGIMVALLISAPLLAVALFVGLIVSVFQALTQIQEPTLTFVPKAIASALVVVFFGSWMLGTTVRFVQTCLEQAAQVVR